MKCYLAIDEGRATTYTISVNGGGEMDAVDIPEDLYVAYYNISQAFQDIQCQLTEIYNSEVAPRYRTLATQLRPIHTPNPYDLAGMRKEAQRRLGKS